VLGSTLAAVRRGFIFYTSRLVRFTTLDLYAVYAAIFVQNRVCRNIAIPFGMEKLEWLGYTMVKKFRRYLYSFWRIMNVTDRRTLHDSKDRAYASHRAVKTNVSETIRKPPLVKA